MIKRNEKDKEEMGRGTANYEQIKEMGNNE
jgi:hypothetical protein